MLRTAVESRRGKILLTTALVAAFVFCLVPLFSTHAAFGLEETKKAIGNANFATSPEQIIGQIIKAALGLIGTIFFILMIYAGFLWMTARGEEGTAKKAKEIIIAAVIGVIIVVSAYAITNTVLNGITGQDQSGGTSTTSGGSNQTSQPTGSQTCTNSWDCPLGQECSLDTPTTCQDSGVSCPGVDQVQCRCDDGHAGCSSDDGPFAGPCVCL